MPVKKLIQFLDENNVKYLTIRHSSPFKPQNIAAKTYISGKVPTTENEFKNHFPDCELGAGKVSLWQSLRYFEI